MKFYLSVRGKIGNLGTAVSVASLVLSAVLASPVQAAGGSDRGGGDTCEKRIQEIRDDIRSWIENDGHLGLSFQSSTREQYERGMLEFLATKKNPNGSISQTTDIECVHRRIGVQDHEKTCRFDLSQSGAKITCDYEAFMDLNTMSEDDQYRLIHHEYAGLAGLENPDGSQSQYALSDQLTKFMETRAVRKLAVRPGDTNEFFTVLNRKFEEGALPSEKLTPGWYSGRCIFPYQTATPEAALLVIQSDDYAGDGPFFPTGGARKYLTQILRADEKRADYFDSIPEDTNAHHEVDLALEKAKLFSLEETTSEFVVQHRDGDLWYRIRENSGTFVVEDHLPRRIYCYFFKKIAIP